MSPEDIVFSRISQAQAQQVISFSHGCPPASAPENHSFVDAKTNNPAEVEMTRSWDGGGMERGLQREDVTPNLLLHRLATIGSDFESFTSKN